MTSVWPPPRSGRVGDPTELEAPLLNPSTLPDDLDTASEDCFLDDAGILVRGYLYVWQWLWDKPWRRRSYVYAPLYWMAFCARIALVGEELYMDGDISHGGYVL